METLDGEALKAGNEAVTVPALSATNVCALDFSEHVSEANHREVVLVYELWQGDEWWSMGIVPFAPNKHLKLGEPELRYDVSETDEGFGITITAQRLARFVWLAIDSPSQGGEGPGTDVVFDDNYFDLPAGRTVTVRLPALDGWTAERVRQSLRVRSLVDSFT